MDPDRSRTGNTPRNNAAALPNWHTGSILLFLVDGGGIEPLSSIPLFYAIGLEDRCGDTIHGLTS